MAASRSSSRSRRSARNSPRGRTQPSVRVADVVRATRKAESQRSAERAIAHRERGNDHHIASDGSLHPGLNAPTREELRSVTDKVLDETLEKKLAELRMLVDRMERIASPFQKPHLETVAEIPLLPRTRGRAVNLGECDTTMSVAGDGPTKDRGAIDSAGGRVRRLTNLVENIRAIVASKAETLLGPSPAAEGSSSKSAGDRSSPSADMHALFTNLDQLDNQVERLEHEVVSLLSQL